jgi:hypothetical protein
MLPLLISALGNRAWGEKGQSRAVGVAMMTLALIIANPKLTLWSPALFALIWFFRVFETGETWLANTAGRNMWFGIFRGALIAPLAILISYVTKDNWPLYVALGFPLPALAYYLAGKVWPPKCTELGELFTGAYLACLALPRLGFLP